MTHRPPVSGEPPEWQKRNVQEFLEQQSRRVSGEPSTERATWQRLTTALRRFAESKADDDWQEVESAMQARDDFHRAEAHATPPSLDAERLKRAMAMWAEESEIDLILPEDAEVVADEYARLTSKEERP